MDEKLYFMTIDKDDQRGTFEMTKRSMLNEIPTLEERDFYLLDKNYNFKTSSIDKKGKLMLVKIDYFRCYIYEDRAYIVVNEIREGEAVIDFYLEDFFGKLSHTIISEEKTQKFKWKVLEHIFIDVSERFHREIETVAPKVSLISNDLFTDEEHVITNRQFMNLKIELLKMKARAKDVYDLFEELTPDDKEDEFDDDNHESKQNFFLDLIEAYKFRFDETYNDIKNMLEILDTAAEINSTQLDEKRNRMQLISIYLEIITLAIAVGALITGAFGMNLRNTWEDSNNAFIIVCSIIGVVVLISLIIVKVVSHRIS